MFHGLGQKIGGKESEKGKERKKVKLRLGLIYGEDKSHDWRLDWGLTSQFLLLQNIQSHDLGRLELVRANFPIMFCHQSGNSKD